MPFYQLYRVLWPAGGTRNLQLKPPARRAPSRCSLCHCFLFFGGGGKSTLSDGCECAALQDALPGPVPAPKRCRAAAGRGFCAGPAVQLRGFRRGVACPITPRCRCSDAPRGQPGLCSWGFPSAEPPVLQGSKLPSGNKAQKQTWLVFLLPPLSLGVMQVT